MQIYVKLRLPEEISQREGAQGEHTSLRQRLPAVERAQQHRRTSWGGGDAAREVLSEVTWLPLGVSETLNSTFS